MTHTNDEKRNFLLVDTGESTGHISDLEKIWLEAETGLTGKSINDMYAQLFTDNSVSNLTQYLAGLGYTGGINKQLQDHYSNPSTLTSNLVSRWRFMGDTTDSVGSTDLTNNNSAALTADKDGVANQAYSFNGSTQYLSGSVLTGINKTTAFSASVWFKTSSPASNMCVFSNVQSTSDRIVINTTSSEIRAGIYNGTEYFVRKSAAISADTWYNVIITFDGSTTFNLYLNGASQAGTSYPSVSNNAGVSVAARLDNTNHFIGDIDEVAVWSRVLSADEIAKVYARYDVW